MVLVLAVAASLVPVLLWLLFFYGHDRYEREPPSLIARLFLWGMIAGPWASGVNVLLLQLLAPVVAALHGAGQLVAAIAVLFAMVALAALNEETMKYIVVSSRTRGDPNFNEPFDGILYMTAAALGFAATENFIYIVNTYFGVLSEAAQVGSEVASAVRRAFIDAFLVLAPGRALLSTIGHVSWSGIVGHFLSGHVLRRISGRSLVGGILFAAALHTAFNFPLFLQQLGLPLGWISWIVWIVGLERYLTLSGRALHDSPFRKRQLGARGIRDDFAARRRRQFPVLLLILGLGAVTALGALAFGLGVDAVVFFAFLFGMAAIAFSRFNWRCPSCGAYLGSRRDIDACPRCKVSFGRAERPTLLGP